ncbi:MAG: hypothetical protein AB7P23_05810 [Amphiplicatus sp.]
MTNTPFDLSDVQERVNETRQALLRADADYEKRAAAAGDRIVKEYLDRFMDDDPRRSQIAKDAAAAIADEIRNFDAVRTGLFVDAALANLKLRYMLNSLQLHVVREGLQHFSAISDELIKALATKRADKPKTDTSDFQAIVKTSYDDARTVGAHVAAIQALAAEIIVIRTETLVSFAKERLTVTLAEALRRIAEHVAQTPRSELLAKSWDAVCEAIAEMASAILDEEIPANRIKKILEILAKGLGAQKAGTSPGDTDVMQNLLPAAHAHQQVLDKLAIALRAAAAAFDEIDRRLKQAGPAR